MFVQLKPVFTVIMVYNYNAVTIIYCHLIIFNCSGDNGTQCSNGNIRLGEYDKQGSYGYGEFHNDTLFRIGYMEVCINGSYRVICNDDLDVESLSYLCQSGLSMELGYPGALYGSESDYLQPGTSLGIYNVNCSTDYFSLSTCSFSTVANNSNGCSANGGAALVTCVNG